MPAVGLAPVYNGQQFFDNNGQMLAGGYLYAYQASSFTVLQPTYNSSTGVTANPNPIQLTSTGRLPVNVWLDITLSYNLVVTLADGVTIVSSTNSVSNINTSNIVTTATIGALAPTLTGTGASGSWNITAAQATATNGLNTTTTPVVVSGAVSPSVGQVLTATGTNAASWQALPTTSSVIAGTMIMWGGSSAPAGYLAIPASATNLSRTTYSTLFAAIGVTWGAGDGFSTFGMPWLPGGYAWAQPYAGLALAGNTVGDNIAHTHTYITKAGTAVQSGSSTPCWYLTTTATTSSQGSAANYPASAGVLFCIKY